MRAAVIIPAHNEGRFIGMLLKSITQYGPPGAQVIVVDNGSTDDTRDIALRGGAQVISTGRLYPGRARNLGAAQAKADILVFLDADVELTAEWRAEWEGTSRVGVTGGICDVSKSPSWIERRWFRHMRLRKRSHVDGANLITTATLFERLGGFDERLETGEDVDFCERAHEIGAEVTVRSGYRVHHEGFPRTISRFIRRERWHGRGDLVSIRRALHSKVVVASILFLVLNGAAALSLCFGDYSAALLWASALTVLCIAGASRALSGSAAMVVFAAAPIMYAYYLGRSLSMWDAIISNRKAGGRSESLPSVRTS